MRYIKAILFYCCLPASMCLSAATGFCQFAGVTVCNQLDDFVVIAGTASGCMRGCSTGFRPGDALGICCSSHYLPQHTCSDFKFGALLATGDFRLHIGENPYNISGNWQSCPKNMSYAGTFGADVTKSTCITDDKLPHGDHPEVVYTITADNAG